MRQRVQSRGFEALEPHEIIEFLLFYAIPRQDVNELAHRLIDRFGNVQAVLSAGIPDLESVPGVGARTARWLALVGEAVASCAALDPKEAPALKNCLDAFRFAARMEREIIPPCGVQLCLDEYGSLLLQRTICDSLSWGEPETLREALGDVMSMHARSVLLLLYAGTRDPDPEDYDITRAERYAAALKAAGCALLDVILVGNGQLNSMNRLRLLPQRELRTTNRTLRETYMRDMPQGMLSTRDFRDPE